ncbi:hypothetical protein SynA1825c_02169 [Synechococcus sp. A18-25c]|nr:hypothetical protein SynA1825c_02169 [Synechococcus sp. A18-25c]
MIKLLPFNRASPPERQDAIPTASQLKSPCEYKARRDVNT